jgi:hypothetical protein
MMLKRKIAYKPIVPVELPHVARPPAVVKWEFSHMDIVNL